MIIEVKTVEILAKQKMQFEATTVVKEEKLIKFMTGFKNSLKETRNDGYIKEVALHLGVDENNNLITREYAKVILNPLFIHSNEKIEEIIQEMKKVKIRLVFNNSRVFCILPAAASLATHRDRASSIPAQDREIPSA